MYAAFSRASSDCSLFRPDGIADLVPNFDQTETREKTHSAHHKVETEKFNNLKRLPKMKCLVHFKKDLALKKIKSVQKIMN